MDELNDINPNEQKTFGTLFSGGELFGVGAEQAGFKHLWGIEYEDKIAAVARLNGFNVITGNVTDTKKWKKLVRPNHIHASPPCPNFSISKTNGGETSLDIELAEAVAWFIEFFKPDTFSLENVTQYYESQSFKIILDSLNKAGYFSIDIQNLNAADFGVPQTRRRMIVRASKGLLMGYPAPVKWVGWLEAIRDLIPELVETNFAQWQIDRLPKEYKDFLIGQGTYSEGLESDSPAPTITSNNNQSGIRAFLMGGANTSKEQAQPGVGVSMEDEPTRAVTTARHEAEAVVTDEEKNSQIESLLVESKFKERNGNIFREGGSPSRTVTAIEPGLKAFIVNTKDPHGESNEFTVRTDREPIYSLLVSAGEPRHKAFVVDGQPNKDGKELTIRDGESPMFTTLSSQEKKLVRGMIPGGKIVKMNIKALGRFQTVPDWYKGLTVKINGNGVPCLLAQRIMETLK